jgi:hypothetical protein
MAGTNMGGSASGGGGCDPAVVGYIPELVIQLLQVSKHSVQTTNRKTHFSLFWGGARQVPTRRRACTGLGASFVPLACAPSPSDGRSLHSALLQSREPYPLRMKSASWHRPPNRCTSHSTPAEYKAHPFPPVSFPSAQTASHRRQKSLGTRTATGRTATGSWSTETYSHFS